MDTLKGSYRFFATPINHTDGLVYYFGINGKYARLDKYINPGYEINELDHNDLIDEIVSNVGQTVPVYFSNVKPNGFVDYVTLPNRNDRYKLEIDFGYPCQYIRFINTKPDDETGSYIQYFIERTGELTYHVKFDAYGAVVNYTIISLLAAFAEDPTVISTKLNDLVSSDEDQAFTQLMFIYNTNFKPSTNKMPLHYEADIVTTAELDMRMYQEYIDISSDKPFLEFNV